MQQRLDLRERVELVLQRTRALAEAMERTTALSEALHAIPDRQDECKDAIWHLSPMEREQLARHCATLAAQLHEVAESFAWMQRYCAEAPDMPMVRR